MFFSLDVNPSSSYHVLISTAEITPGPIWVKILTQIAYVGKVSNHTHKKKKVGVICEIKEKALRQGILRNKLGATACT